VIGGCVAGLSQSILACPAELIKIREQLPGIGATANGPWHVARQIYRTNGFQGMFRGLGLTAARDMPAFGLYFGVYDTAKHLMGLHTPALWEDQEQQLRGEELASSTRQPASSKRSGSGLTDVTDANLDSNRLNLDSNRLGPADPWS